MKILEGEEGLQTVVTMLLAGDCVALPTETVYGLAADASQPGSVAKIFAAKNRPADHPLIVHIASAEQLADWAIEVPQVAYELAKRFWPGPLTLLLHKAPAIPGAVTGGKKTIALRVPQHPLFLEVLNKTGLGLAAPSANRYKQLSPTTAAQVVHGMQDRIAAVLDGGPCEFGLESTILDLTSDQPAILRSGPINRSALETAIKQPVNVPEQHDVAVPGNVAAHYQPRAKLNVCERQALVRAEGASAGYLIYSEEAVIALETAGVAKVHIVRLPDSAAPFGQGLYHSLHQLDLSGVSEIRVEQPPGGESWAAVNDRLSRASG